MTTPIPTPYDIVDPPFFPYAPGAAEWTVIGVLALLGLIGLALLHTVLRPGGKLLAALNLALRDLHALLERGLPPSETLSAASLTCRRVLGHLLGLDCSSMSSRELEQQQSQTLGAGTKEFLATLIEIERLRFSAVPDPARVRDLVQRCRSNLESIKLTEKAGQRT